MSSLGELLHGGPVGSEEVARVRETVVFEQPDLQVKLVRFWILIGLAAAISTYGLLSDSVAAVIGAMIVAPLMLPIMGAAFSISLGDGKALINSVLVGLSGILIAIGTGWLLTQTMPAAFDPEQVGQIMTRTAPRLLDLLAALATGLAGAFAIGRKDVSDTLPGVAIAISLVPPLANVGLLLAAGRPDLAQGSFLLFVTNYFAIVLTGTLVFGLMGFPRVSFAGQSKRQKRIAIFIVFVMLFVIVLPLGVQSLTVWVKHSAEGIAADATNEWLEGSGYTLVSTTVDDEFLVIVVEGMGGLPAEKDLMGLLDGNVYSLPVRVEAIASQQLEFTTQ